MPQQALLILLETITQIAMPAFLLILVVGQGEFLEVEGMCLL